MSEKMWGKSPLEQAWDDFGLEGIRRAGEKAMRERLQLEETQLRTAAAPLISQGYRIEELEQRIRERSHEFLGVFVRKPAPRHILLARRIWRRMRTYSVKGVRL